MVTFINTGRMGNFLFQAATTMAYAWRHGLDFSVPRTTRNDKDHPVYLPHLVNPNWDPNAPRVRVAERGHGYQQIPFKQEWSLSTIVLDGYWQSEKYFKEYRERILEQFNFDWKPLPGVISVHVRRGDYLTIQRGGMFKHPPVTKEWYAWAMAKFPIHLFHFFSDDIEWCQENFGHRKDCVFSHANERVDLMMGSWCEHHICSASTFSWWQAWLNRNPKKRVIMPAHWLTPGWADLDMSDIVPPGWERME